MNSGFQIEDFLSLNASKRAEAKDRVARDRPPEAVPAFIDFLEGPDPDIEPFVLRYARGDMYQLLGLLGDPSAQEVLIKGMIRDAEQQGIYAAHALSQLGSSISLPSVLSILMLDHQEWKILCRQVAEIVDSVDRAQGIRLLGDLLSNESSHVQRNAIYTLGCLKAEEQQQAIERRRSHEELTEAIDFAAARFLEKRLQEDQSIPQSVVDLLSHRDPGVVNAAIASIERHGNDHEIGELIRLLGSRFQTEVVDVLRNRGTEDHARLILEQMANVDMYQREAMAEALGDTVSADQEYGLIAELERDQTQRTRQLLVDALANIDESTASRFRKDVEPNAVFSISDEREPRDIDRQWPFSSRASSDDPLHELEAEPASAKKPRRNLRRVRDVLFVTDRQRSRLPTLNIDFGRKRSDQISFGYVSVSLPAEEHHKIGRIERPKWWRLQFQENARKHFVLVGSRLCDESEFLEIARNQLNPSKANALLFIHGYNVKFRDAVFRTAQLAHDLRFEGPTITYSWPSHGRVIDYLADANNVEWTRPHLKQAIQLLRRSLELEELHVIAHSMGNRALLSVLKDLAEEHIGGQVILAAPDIDQDVFRDLAQALPGNVTRVTLYASATDRALLRSKQLQGGYPRAGDVGDSIIVMPGVDTIDATNVSTSFLGHSYIGDERALIQDIYHLISQNSGPDQRFGMVSVEHGPGKYWRFLP